MPASSCQECGEAKPRPSSSGGGGEDTDTAFASHAEEEAARRAAAEEDALLPKSVRSLQVGTFLGRIILYLLVPALTGVIGVLAGYLSRMRDAAESGGQIKAIDLDRDFFFPFFLALAMVIVVGFQTRGFTTRDVKPVVAWPKVRKKRRITRRVVVVDDDGKEIEQEEEEDRGGAGEEDDGEEVADDDRAALEEWREDDEKNKRSGRGTRKED